MDLMQLLAHPLSIGRELATKRVIAQFAHKFDLVYFGAVNQREDAHELIRGVTLTAAHEDNHFCVGHFQGHDISLVERRNTVTFPERPPRHYHWLIMQVDLHRDDLPMIFMDAHHHDQAFYETLSLKFANLSNAASLFVERDTLFERSFVTFTPADKFDEVDQLITHDIAAMLAHHFKQFDYEINGDHVLIYATQPTVTMHLMQEMLRVGLWLASQLEKPEI